MSVLIDTLLDKVRREFQQKAPQWSVATMTSDDIQFLDEECTKDSEFDPLNKRKEMYSNMKTGLAVSVVAKCEYGQVIAVFDNSEQLACVPWDLWGRIFRMYSDRHGNKPFKVYFLANTHLRKFPPAHQAIKPQNINGGYTYRCNRETILIYRAEDATRVLIHELMHSCCLDKHENGVDIVEAETEAWAELVYTALLSQGKRLLFKDLLKRQSEWMVKQNEEVKKHMRDPTSREFPWRYTIGKEEVWRRWGVLRESPKIDVKLGNSLRLTYPPSNKLKEEFKVESSSTIL